MTGERQLDKAVRKAVRAFWQTRRDQGTRQGMTTGTRDAGSRTDVTGGAHMKGFAILVQSLLVECGLPETQVSVTETTLPGYFRPTKQWDLVAVWDEHLVATIEFKSHVGPSFGNNFNNRVEEAVGSATDLWAGYKHGVYKPSQRPWVGYLMLVEDCEASRRTPTRKLRASHFEVMPAIQYASYIGRYENLCKQLVRERLYDAACLLVSSKEAGQKGDYAEPCKELTFRILARSLMGHASSFGTLPPK